MIEFFTDLFSPITAILHMLLEFLYGITSSFGLVSYGYPIILLTILIKVAMAPLTARQIQSMKAMQDLQPKLQKIQEKYKNNPEMLRQKMAQLYSDSGVNPLAGCWPLLIQMPILMAMYYALYAFNYPTPEQAQFFWVPSMSAPDPLYILPIISAVTTFLQQKLSTSSEANAQMKMMMFIMPLFIGWISLSFPSGLVLYWATMNVVQIAQQLWMQRVESKAKEA